MAVGRRPVTEELKTRAAVTSLKQGASELASSQASSTRSGGGSASGNSPIDIAATLASQAATGLRTPLANSSP